MIELTAELAQTNNFGDTRGGALAGPLGLFIIALLAIATVFLIRHMNGRLRRLPGSFMVGETQPASQDAAPNDAVDAKPQ